MAGRQFAQKPQPHRRPGDDPLTQHPQSWQQGPTPGSVYSPMPTGSPDSWQQPAMPHSAAQGARGVNDTLGNIDDVLADNDAMRRGMDGGPSEPDPGDAGDDGWYGRNRQQNEGLPGVRDREANPESDPAKNDAETAEDDKLGRGYSGGGKKSNKKPKILGTRMRRGMATAGIFAGSGVLAAFVAFFMALPMKVEAMVRNLEEQYMSQAYAGVQDASLKIFSDFVEKAIIPNFNATCKNTVDPHCTFVSPGTDPINRFYQSWHKVKFEKELADKYGIIIGKRGGGITTPKYYMNLNGKEMDITELQKGKKSLFDLPDTKELSRGELRRTIMDALEKSAHPKSVYKRFAVDRYLRKQFGIGWCDQHCKWYEGTRNKIDDATATVSDKKLAFKAWSIQKLVPEKYGIVMTCILDIDVCAKGLDSASEDDVNRMSPAQKSIRETLMNARTGFHSETLEKMAKYAAEIGDEGLQTYVVRALMTQVASKFLSEETVESITKASLKVMEKVIPVIGWIITAAKVLYIIDKAPGVYRKVMFTIKVTTALSTVGLYMTHASEVESGNTDPEIQGAFDQSLTANALDSGEFASDMADTPLFHAMMGTLTVNPVAFLGGKAYAQDTTPTTRFKCDDGEPINVMALGRLTCFTFIQSNEILQGIRDFVGHIPGIFWIAATINAIINVLTSIIPSGLISEGIEKACSLPKPVQWVIGVGPLCLLMKKAEEYMPKLLAFIVKHIDFIRLDGGGHFEAAAAGMSVSGNNATRDLLGGMPASAEAVSEVRNEYIAQQKENFRHRSLTARLFAHDTPYSLSMRVALANPMTEPSLIPSQFIAGLSNPVEQVASSLSTLGQSHAIASSPAIAKTFGETLYLAPPIPTHPTQYWMDNCQQRYNETNGELDNTDFLNNHTKEDELTGVQVNTAPNTCQAILQGLQGLGALSGGFKIPDDAFTGSTTSTPSDTGTCYDDPATPEKETTDLGVQDGYDNGNKTPITVCAVSNMPSGASESTKGSEFYIEGADGKAIVNASMSENWYNLAKDAQAAGITPQVTSGFRSMANQEKLCNANYECAHGINYNSVAQPGHSNHQMGEAIDFTGPGPKKPSATSCANRGTAPGSPIWVWLDANSYRYGGIQQYMVEPWHWDIEGGSTRCGGGAPA
jgi:hypothetical protein